MSSRQSREYAVSSRLFWRYTGAAQGLEPIPRTKAPAPHAWLHAAARCTSRVEETPERPTRKNRVYVTLYRVVKLNAMNLVQQVCIKILTKKFRIGDHIRRVMTSFSS